MNRMPAPGHFLTGLLVGATVAFTAAIEASSQQPAIIGGIILDENTLEPVPGARVSIQLTGSPDGTGIETESRADGTFGFLEVSEGLTTLRVNANGRPVLVDQVAVSTEAVAFVRFEVPAIDAVLSELLVEATDTDDFPADLTAADLVARQLPGFSSVPPGVGRDEYYGRLKLRGSSSLRGDGEPAVFLDGIRIGGVSEALDQLALIPSADVESVTALMGPAAAFAHAMAANGAIMVQTRSGPAP